MIKIIGLCVGLTFVIFAPLAKAASPAIVDRPIAWTEYRERLAEEYALKHYGSRQTEIVPQAVVIHWTASDNGESVYNWFNREAANDGTLQVSSQFMVERDGTIYRFTPETKMNRHIIGYNHCAVGIENVGGATGKEDLTDAQLAADTELIRYLKRKYPSIRYVFGHYRQTAARASGLYRELVPGYASQKIDPGEKFMQALHETLKDDGLIFF